MTQRRFFCIATAATLACRALPGLAQDAAGAWPTRPVKFIVPASAGGPTDAIGRLVAERLGHVIGQAIVVENRPGASATLGPLAVAKSAADGYTLLFTSSTPLVVVPATMKNVPYDVQKDLAPISVLGGLPLALFVNASSPVTNVRQLVDEIKARPGAANYGSYGNGTTAHVLMEVLIKQLKVQMVHVPYKGIAPGLQDLMGGQLMTSVSDIGTAAPLVKGGRIRAIALAGSRRSPLMPDVPTFAEQGVGGMEPFSSWFGLFAPAGTPKPLVERLSVELVKITKSPEFSAKLATFGVDPTGTTAAQAAEITRNDMARWQAIIREMPHINFE